MQLAQLPGANAPGRDGMLQLRPVRVASRRPPLQMFRIQNAGPATMYWRLDLEALEALKAKYHGCGSSLQVLQESDRHVDDFVICCIVCRHDVLTLVGPSCGTCAPSCFLTLNWLFDPIVPEVHAVEIPVHVGDGTESSSCLLHLCAEGMLQQPSAVQLQLQQDCGAELGCVIPQSPSVRLLEPSIDLGVTSPHGALRALAVIESTSQRDVLFKWHAGELNGEGASEGSICFEPAEGILYPGERVGCLVTYHAGSEDQWLEGEVALRIAEGDEAGTGTTPSTCMVRKDNRASMCWNGCTSNWVFCICMVWGQIQPHVSGGMPAQVVPGRKRSMWQKVHMWKMLRRKLWHSTLLLQGSRCSGRLLRGQGPEPQMTPVQLKVNQASARSRRLEWWQMQCGKMSMLCTCGLLEQFSVVSTHRMGHVQHLPRDSGAGPVRPP